MVNSQSLSNFGFGRLGGIIFYWKRPQTTQIDQVLAGAIAAAFTYTEIEATRHQPSPNLAGQQTASAPELPAGYVVDHNWVKLGEGQATYQRAQNALRQWQMFNLGWVQLCQHSSIRGAAPLEIDTVVAVLASQPFWSLNPARIVYTIDVDEPARSRFGFGYGTVPGHIAKGEERFQVVWNREDGSVWYEVLAFSRPDHWLAKAGYPVVRLFQRRFAQDSKRAMLEACSL